MFISLLAGNLSSVTVSTMIACGTNVSNAGSNNMTSGGRAVSANRQNISELLGEQVGALYRNAGPGTYGSLFAGAILSGMLYFSNAIPLRSALTFIIILSASSITRLFLLRAYRLKKPPLIEWRKWAWAATASALGGGMCWGSASIFLMDPSRVEFQFIVVLACAGLSAGSIAAFGTYLPAYYASLFPMMVPTVIWAAYQNDPIHWTYAILGSLWIVVMAMIARTVCRSLVQSLRLQFENLALANDLRIQKESAEDANMAKSRFLAAASHDLRQPVHALEMFVGALAAQPMGAESKNLVSQIGNSVESLNGLFNAILDISRLDAGVVDVRERAFPIGPLLERICIGEGEEAKRKNLELRLVPCRAVVLSDPVLLERVLRNLISNAVRHTVNGKIVVGCRRGERLSVEVWDSGVGISPEQQSLIFEEFYQVGNPERSRSRGLGLGLAIVRRLAQMLDMPLSVQSQLGKGSVFKLSVALARGDEAVRHLPLESFSQGEYQRRLSVLVIDDEPEIQAAMQALLSSWGHAVLTVSSGDEALTRSGELGGRLDVIISDYRLAAGENGIATIQRVRAHFAEDVPAILATGDTAADRLREAMASGCFLMHKPISNARLRAALMNLTRAGPQSAS